MPHIRAPRSLLHGALGGYDCDTPTAHTFIMNSQPTGTEHGRNTLSRPTTIPNVGKSRSRCDPRRRLSSHQHEIDYLPNHPARYGKHLGRSHGNPYLPNWIPSPLHHTREQADLAAPEVFSPKDTYATTNPLASSTVVTP